MPPKKTFRIFRCSLMTKTITSTATIFLLTIFPLFSKINAQQIPANDIYREYLQTLSINGDLSTLEYPQYSSKRAKILMNALDSLGGQPWADRDLPVYSNINDKPFNFAFHDPELRSYWQSLEPGGYHDGPIWQGRGLTSDLSAGFFIRYGILSASLRPHLIFNQNQSFNLSRYETNASRSVYAYPLGNIDWPQRYGNSPFWSYDWGNTYIRADYRGWATGISNENMRWGPARQNALLMDSNAPGFRHFFIETSKPKDIYIGHLETAMFWGKLWESDYFDDTSINDERYITGLTVSINPRPIPNLRVGINRVFYETIPPEGIPAGDLLKIFEAFTKINFVSTSNLGGNDQADQLLSICWQWTFPESGLEIYGEWARTDHSWNWREFFTEPEHSRGYTLGLQKTFDLSNKKILSVNAELTQLEASKTGAFRGYPTFYVHGRSTQGYTNEGQLLGASIGPGSSSQYLGSSLYFNKGRIKVFAQRVAQNNDFLYRSNAMYGEDIQSSEIPKYWLHNIEMRIGSSLTYFYKQFETSFGVTYRYEMNDDYIYQNDKNHWGVQLSLRYRLSSLR